MASNRRTKGCFAWMENIVAPICDWGTKEGFRREAGAVLELVLPLLFLVRPTFV